MSNHLEDDLIPIGMGIDQHAVLFKTGNKILRAIKPKFSDFYHDVMQNPVICNLMKEGLLIEAKPSDIKIAGFSLVIEHPLLPTVSYPFEWTPSMYKDAAVTLLKLNIELLDAGFCTHDAHPWNILFDGVTPKFIDFTSIIKPIQGKYWRARKQFDHYFLNPLLIMEAGFPTTSRQLSRAILEYPDPLFVSRLLNGPRSSSTLGQKGKNLMKLGASVAAKLPEGAKNPLRKIFNATENSLYQWTSPVKGDLKEIQKLLSRTQSLNVRPQPGQWSEYYAGNNELPVYDGAKGILQKIQNATPKHAIISDLLNKAKPTSVLDLGCNRGLYSQLAALQGARTIGIDTDERALDDMYLDSKRFNTNALPLYINAVSPAEAIGFKELPFPSITNRLRCEMVLCLALVHHLVFKTTSMSFAHISKLLDSYSERFLAVEFIPKGDKHIQGWVTDDFDWYTVENFRKALSVYFPLIQIFESYPSPRVILFCEKSKK